MLTKGKIITNKDHEPSINNPLSFLVPTFNFDGTLYLNGKLRPKVSKSIAISHLISNTNGIVTIHASSGHTIHLTKENIYFDKENRRYTVFDPGVGIILLGSHAILTIISKYTIKNEEFYIATEGKDLNRIIIPNHASNEERAGIIQLAINTGKKYFIYEGGDLRCSRLNKKTTGEQAIRAIRLA